MIDTDKYEGHSTGWKLKMNYSSATIWNDEGHKVATTHYYDSPSNRHDRFIIEDSLKLLAEVKRLREELFDTHAFYSIMEQKLAFAVGIKQGLLPSLSMDDLVDSMNRDYHDRLNEHMNGRLKKND